MLAGNRLRRSNRSPDIVLAQHRFCTSTSSLASLGSARRAGDRPLHPHARTTATRNRDRMHYDRAAAHAILDEAYDCSVALRRRRRAADAADPARPRRTTPSICTARPAAGSACRPAAAASPICLSVTLLDGIVYGRSQFHHSANYRSVVAHGTARPVTDNVEKRMAMTALVEKVGRGRAADSRPPTRRGARRDQRAGAAAVGGVGPGSRRRGRRRPGRPDARPLGRRAAAATRGRTAGAGCRRGRRAAGLSGHRPVALGTPRHRCRAGTYCSSSSRHRMWTVCSRRSATTRSGSTCRFSARRTHG